MSPELIFALRLSVFNKDRHTQGENIMKLAAIAIASTLFAGAAFAKTCDVTVEGSDAMSYNTKTIVTTGCKEVKLTLKHAGKLPKAAMGHNLVITAEADMKKTIDAGTKAGPAKDYSPGTDGVIAATKLLGGGESITDCP